MEAAAWSLIGALTALLSVAVGTIGILTRNGNGNGNGKKAKPLQIPNPHARETFMADMSVEFFDLKLREALRQSQSGLRDSLRTMDERINRIDDGAVRELTSLKGAIGAFETTLTTKLDEVVRAVQDKGTA